MKNQSLSYVATVFKKIAAADSRNPVLSGSDGTDKQLEKEPVL